MLSSEDFFVCMKPLTRHWPEPMMEQWADYRAILGHLDARVLAAAVLQVLASHVYPTFPKPAVILDAAGRVLAPVGRSGLEAWGDVLEKVREHGYLRQPQFSDPLVADVVRGLSWREVCLSEEPMVVRAHFIKAYEQMQARGVSQACELPAVSEARQLAAGEKMRQLTAGIGKPR